MARAELEKAERLPAVGKALVVMGTILFAAEGLYSLMQAAFSWGFSGLLSAVAVAGLQALQIVTNIAWNQGATLAALAKVLVVCWPLLLVTAGIVLLRKKTVSS